MRRTPSFLLLGASLVGCAPTGPSKTPAPVVAPRSALAPTRSIEECAPLVTRIRAHPDSFPPTQPAVKGLVTPPLDGTPPALRDRTVTVSFFVDARGDQLQDSTTIVPALDDREFERRLRATLAGYQFRPAVVEGCGVPARTQVRITLASH